MGASSAGQTTVKGVITEVTNNDPLVCMYKIEDTWYAGGRTCMYIYIIISNAKNTTKACLQTTQSIILCAHFQKWWHAMICNLIEGML